MRSLIALTAFASFAALAPTPSPATERLAKPAGATTLVTRTADTGRPWRFRMIHIHRKPAWLVRAHANRWLHYQYVNAGYPVRHYDYGTYYTYLPGPLCCGYGRHW